MGSSMLVFRLFEFCISFGIVSVNYSFQFQLCTACLPSKNVSEAANPNLVVEGDAKTEQTACFIS